MPEAEPWSSGAKEKPMAGSGLEDGRTRGPENGSLAIKARLASPRVGEVCDVSVNVFFTIFTNTFSPIAPTRIRRIRQRGCAAFGA